MNIEDYDNSATQQNHEIVITRAFNGVIVRPAPRDGGYMVPGHCRELVFQSNEALVDWIQLWMKTTAVKRPGDTPG